MFGFGPRGNFVNLVQEENVQEAPSGVVLDEGDDMDTTVKEAAAAAAEEAATQEAATHEAVTEPASVVQPVNASPAGPMTRRRAAEASAASAPAAKRRLFGNFIF